MRIARAGLPVQYSVIILVPLKMQVYQQQQEIAAELRRIRSLAAAQEAQTARYAAAVERVDAALRELGDADNYM